MASLFKAAGQFILQSKCPEEVVFGLANKTALALSIALEKRQLKFIFHSGDRVPVSAVCGQFFEIPREIVKSDKGRGKRKEKMPRRKKDGKREMELGGWNRKP